MRIVAGRLGGRRLSAPPGRGTRPTSDRVREALFAMLEPLEGTRVLDLFAGSGALGLEALSRGAAQATFVDSAPASARTIRGNLQALGVQAEVLPMSAASFLRRARAEDRQYDLVFLDPPYALAEDISTTLPEALWPVLAADATVVCESDRRRPLALTAAAADGSRAPVLRRERTYGDTLIRIYDT